MTEHLDRAIPGFCDLPVTASKRCNELAVYNASLMQSRMVYAHYCERHGEQLLRLWKKYGMVVKLRRRRIR